jgi:hypothetical protein
MLKFVAYWMESAAGVGVVRYVVTCLLEGWHIPLAWLILGLQIRPFAMVQQNISSILGLHVMNNCPCYSRWGLGLYAELSERLDAVCGEVRRQFWMMSKAVCGEGWIVEGSEEVVESSQPSAAKSRGCQKWSHQL